MIREEKIEFTTKWCKYSKYMIEKKDDKYYMLPDKNAKPSTYDPFEIKNQILKDLLVIGKESVDNEMFKLGNKEVSIEALSKIEKFQNLVLEFVNNYGLLGNFRYLPENYDFMDNGEIPVNLGYNTSINDIIESKNLHDCVSCKCVACSIDGGNQYTRIGGDFKYINCINEDGTEEPLIKNNAKVIEA